MNLSEIRELVQNSLRGFRPDIKPLGERVLLKGRFYAGRRFEFEGFSAVWFIDADEIKFFDGSGKLLFSIHPSETQQEVRRAA